MTEELHTSDTLAMFYLKRFRPEFRESFVVEQTGPGGGPLKHEVTVVDEAVAEFRADLARLAEDD